MDATFVQTLAVSEPNLLRHPRSIGDVTYGPVETSAKRVWAEIAIVLGLSFGASALYSIIAIVYRETRQESLAEQTATINSSLSDRPVFDLIYQIMGIAVDLVPVALVGFLVWQFSRPRLGRLGLTFERPWRDGAAGVALAAVIGIPGIFVYLGGRAAGITVGVVPEALDPYWWTIPVLVLRALTAGITEEVIVVGYLFARLRDLGWGTWQIIIASALLRGTYHLYQGYGSFFGNVAMGVFFGWLYSRYGRVLPLVIAHSILDIVAFVGYAWAAATFPALFGAPTN